MDWDHLLLFFFNLFAVFSVKIGKVEGIVGGQFAGPGLLTYQISLQVNGFHTCGGGIIADELVLTAAHCVVRDNLEFRQYQWIVVAGVFNTRSKNLNKVERRVSKIYVPADYVPIIAYQSNNTMPLDYEKDPKSDIAVLRLENSLGLSTNFGLSKLSLPQPSDSLETYEFTDPVISGFGFSKVVTRKNIFGVNTIEFSNDCDNLKYAETWIMPSSKCQSTYSFLVRPSHLCAQIKQRDPDHAEGTCKGDSGSPLVLNGNTVIGVLFGINEDCSEAGDQAGIYTKVGFYLDFINKAKLDEISPKIRVAAYRTSTIFLIRYLLETKVD